MKQDVTTWKHADWRFWLLVFFLFVVSLTGGSSRSDVQSLIVLWPLSVVVFAIGAASLKFADIKYYRALCIFAMVPVITVLIYVTPMPDFILRAFPSLDMSRTVELSFASEPLIYSAALVPMEAWSSLLALSTPFAVLVLAMQLNHQDLYRLLPVIVGLSMLSAFVAFLQILGDSEGALYLYEISNKGRAVGLFANRNHQAVLLAILFPMLAVFASVAKANKKSTSVVGWIAVAAGIFLVPLILVTGSRAGFIFGIIAVIAGMCMYQGQRESSKPKSRILGINWQIPVVAAGIVLLGLTSLVLSRAEAITRFGDETTEHRFEFWVRIMALSRDSMPFGIGPGGFVAAYAKIEPFELLDATYLNRAHNDWLEIIASFGIAGFVLIFAVTSAFCVRSFAILKKEGRASRHTLFAKLGMVIIAIIGLASFFDYPLRTPIMAAFSVVALLWFSTSQPSNNRIGA